MWLFKPHPALKFKCLYVGLFKDEEEWDAYVQEWEDLKNGMVYQGSEYADYFRCSDALILDSSSFIAEYLFVNKPALFLTRKEQRFNDTGNCLVSLLYKAAGKQSSDIEKFVDEVVLSGKDEKKEERMYAFTKYLDSRCIIEQGTNASMNIFHLFCAYLDKEV